MEKFISCSCISNRFKKKLSKFRPKIYVVVSLVKMLVIFGCMIVIFIIDGYNFYDLFEFHKK